MKPSLALSPLRRALAGLLICALLLTQALGLLHRVLHSDVAEHAVRERVGIDALFPHDHGSADCQTYDQLSHADGMGFGFVEPGGLPPVAAPVTALPLPMLAAQATGYLARGPPGTA